MFYFFDFFFNELKFLHINNKMFPEYKLEFLMLLHHKWGEIKKAHKQRVDLTLFVKGSGGARKNLIQQMSKFPKYFVHAKFC